MERESWRAKVEETVERMDIDVTFPGDGNAAEFEFCSGAGEDFVFSVEAPSLDDLEAGVWAYACDFDPEEHAVGWFRAGRGEPGSIRTLLDDADGIAETLSALASALCALRRDAVRLEA